MKGNCDKSVKIYVAGPYTKPDPEANTIEAIRVANKVMALGFVPFLPHLTHYWELRHPHAYEDWLAYDMHWLRVCDGLLRMPGESNGAEKEVGEATRLGIPVFSSMLALSAYDFREAGFVTDRHDHPTCVWFRDGRKVWLAGAGNERWLEVGRGSNLSKGL